MPIYVYKCESCGFAKDVLQKMSDAQLSECPNCGASAFKKQLTAAGFQLKGSGWYATDFKGGGAAANAPVSPTPDGAGAVAPAAEGAKPSASPTAKPVATAAPAAASGAGGIGASH